MNSHFIWSCGRKRHFKNKDQAKYWYDVGRKNGVYDDNIHIYQCNYCTGFHIGHAAPKIDPSRMPAVVIVEDVKPVAPTEVKQITHIDGVALDYVDEQFGYVFAKRNKRFYKLLNKGWQYLKEEGLLRKAL